MIIIIEIGAFLYLSLSVMENGMIVYLRFGDSSFTSLVLVQLNTL